MARAGAWTSWNAGRLERIHKKDMERRVDLEQAFRAFVPVESFTEERVTSAPIPTPEVGLRWGAQSEFEFETEEEKEENKRGGVSARMFRYRWDPLFGKTKYAVDLTDYSPVWREYEIIKVFAGAPQSDGTVVFDEDNYIEVQSTLSMLVPLEERTLKYINGWYAGKPVFQERKIKAFFKMHFPRILPDAPRVGKGVEGKWPEGQTELLGDPGRWTRPIVMWKHSSFR